MPEQVHEEPMAESASDVDELVIQIRRLDKKETTGDSNSQGQ